MAEEHGIGSNSQSGYVFDGAVVSDLSLSDAEKGFFVAEVDLDVPAPDIGLNKLVDRRVRVSADQIGGFAIKKARMFREPVSQRRDDDEPKIMVSTNSPPA